MIRLIFLFVLVCAGTAVMAQRKFMAYSVTGKASYRIQGRQYALKTGKVIPETASVVVADQSTVLMICENASEPVTLEKGVHQLSSFSNVCDPNVQSATANYLRYVWWQMTNPKGSTEDERKRTIGSSIAVSRGCPGVDLFVADTLNYFSENILLSWKVFAPDVRPEFALYQDPNSPLPLLVLPLRKKELPLDSIKKWLEPGLRYYWTITLNGNQVCERKLIQVWEAENFREFTDSLRTQLVPGTTAAEQEYQMGFMLEQLGFTGEAYRHYRQARKLDRRVDRYKRTVKRFQILYGEED